MWVDDGIESPLSSALYLSRKLRDSVWVYQILQKTALISLLRYCSHNLRAPFVKLCKERERTAASDSERDLRSPTHTYLNFAWNMQLVHAGWLVGCASSDVWEDKSLEHCRRLLPLITDSISNQKVIKIHVFVFSSPQWSLPIDFLITLSTLFY